MRIPRMTTRRWKIAVPHMLTDPTVWLLLLSAATIALCDELSFRLNEGLRFADMPGQNPPWYFIRRDFVHGACRGLGLAFCLSIAFLARRRYPDGSHNLAWFSVLWNGGYAWKALVIWFSGRHLLNPRLATTRWESSEAYFSDALIWAGMMGVILLAIAIAWRTNTTDRKDAIAA